MPQPRPFRGSRLMFRLWSVGMRAAHSRGCLGDDTLQRPRRATGFGGVEFALATLVSVALIHLTVEVKQVSRHLDLRLLGPRTDRRVTSMVSRPRTGIASASCVGIRRTEPNKDPGAGRGEPCEGLRRLGLLSPRAIYELTPSCVGCRRCFRS